MITKSVWDTFIFSEKFLSWFDYCITVIITPITLLLDILFLPFELIALIIYRIREGKWKDE